MKKEEDWKEAEWKDDFSSTGEPTNDIEYNEQFPDQNEMFHSDEAEDSLTNDSQGLSTHNYDEIDETIKAKRPPLPQKAIDIEIDLRSLGTGAVAGIIFVRSFFQGAVIGGLFGGLQGLVIGYQNRAALGGKIAPHVMQMSWASGKSFGLWLGTFQASNVLLARIRHKKDVVNPFISGFLAGTISSLSTRNRTQILYNGFTSAMLMSLMHTFSGGVPQLVG